MAALDALYVCTDAAIIHTNRLQINTSALRERLPTMQGARSYLEGGGLNHMDRISQTCLALRRFCGQNLARSKPRGNPR